MRQPKKGVIYFNKNQHKLVRCGCNSGYCYIYYMLDMSLSLSYIAGEELEAYRKLLSDIYQMKVTRSKSLGELSFEDFRLPERK